VLWEEGVSGFGIRARPARRGDQSTREGAGNTALGRQLGRLLHNPESPGRNPGQTPKQAKAARFPNGVPPRTTVVLIRWLSEKMAEAWGIS
jgi:hypothetical protein